MNSTVGVYLGPKKGLTGLCLKPLLQLQLCCLIMCRRRWILSIFPHLLVHQPANKRSSTALYPIGNAVWQQILLEICPFLPYCHSCFHVKSLEALMEWAGSCSHTCQQHRGQGGLWEDPSTHCRLLHHQSQLLCLVSRISFTSAIHWVQSTFLPNLPSPSISPLRRGSACGQMPSAALRTGQSHDLSSWDKGTGQSHDLSSHWKQGRKGQQDLNALFLVLGVKQRKAIKRKFAGVRKRNNSPSLLLFAREIL